MRIHCCLLIAVLLATLPLQAQRLPITGVLKNASGKPIAQVSVLLKNEAGNIIGYNYSNKGGMYSISVPDTIERKTWYLEINWLGYKKIQQTVTPQHNTYNLVLEEAVIELNEVKVKAGPVIRQSGDTLSYDVRSFSRNEDRSIGDVLGRLPGVVVDDDGTINYNGKKISNLYVGGDNLMGGRYGLATKTISKEMIKSIEVMERYQPVKVLKNKQTTNDVAINLVLKDENSIHLSGQAMPGAGLPQQLDVALNTMLFNKKIKMLNSLKANNSGIDYRPEFNQLGGGAFLLENNRPGSLLSDATVGSPDIPKRDYYFNRSAVLNANNLVNTSKGMQLRSNIQLFLDRNTGNYGRTVRTFLPGDTIQYNERQSFERKPFTVNVSLGGMVNKPRYYLENTLQLNFSGSNNNSLLQFNGKGFGQQLHTVTKDIANDFQWVPALRNRGAFSVGWHLGYYTMPQRLNIDSGLHSNILNNNLPFAALEQQAETPTLLSNLSASYLSGKQQGIRHTYQFGIINEWQQLNSLLQLTEHNGTITKYRGDVGNTLLWQRNKLYINPQWSLQKNTWNVSLSVPLAWQTVHYRQQAYQLDSTKKQLLLNPAVSIKLYTNAQDYLTASYRYQNSLGNITGVYRGLILANYYALNANDAGLQEQNISSVGFNYYVNRAIRMLFMNAGLQYGTTTASSIPSSIITNEVQRTVLLPYENRQRNITATGEISKFIIKLNTKVSLKLNWRRAYADQLINGQRLSFTNDIWTWGAGLSTKFFQSVTLGYNGSFNFFYSKQAGTGKAGPATYSKRFDQQFSLGYAPLRNLFLTIKGRQLYNSQPGLQIRNYCFLDANIRYKILKWRTDVEIDITNLLNIRQYEIYSLSVNQFAASSYAIRGSMGMVRCTFNL